MAAHQTATLKRYEAFADDIAHLIRSGRLQAGDRLPSVREASHGRGISPSTVFQGYYLLEDRGLIEARPRSGYFVKSRPTIDESCEPDVSEPAARSHDVTVSELVFQVLSQARNRDIVPLGSAFPSPTLFPLEKLSRATGKAMRRIDPWRTVEDLAPGSVTLRRQIALRYLASGYRVAADEIVITNGAMEALNLCLEVVTMPGDVVAVESPTFYGSLQALERRGLRAVEVATHPRHGVELEALAAVLDRHPVKACWFMTNFQNPLGALMPTENKRELVAMLAQRNIPLIEDDVYGELYFGNGKPPPAKAFDRQGLVLHCSSFSKSLAPGYRVGWAAAGSFVHSVAQRKLMSSLGAAVPSQEGLSEYLQHGAFDRHLRQLRQVFEANQAIALRAIGRWFPSGTRVTRPEGGYFLWVELPRSVDALQLHRLGLAQNISVAPGHLFSPDRGFAHCVRINVGHPNDRRVESALRTLGQIARSMV